MARFNCRVINLFYGGCGAHSSHAHSCGRLLSNLKAPAEQALNSNNFQQP